MHLYWFFIASYYLLKKCVNNLLPVRIKIKSQSVKTIWNAKHCYSLALCRSQQKRLKNALLNQRKIKQINKNWQHTSFSIFFRVFPLGPIKRPTKLMFGLISWGIATRSLMRWRVGLQKKLYIISVFIFITRRY